MIRLVSGLSTRAAIICRLGSRSEHDVLMLDVLSSFDVL